jgi:uncharacterized integral membrane protein
MADEQARRRDSRSVREWAPLVALGVVALYTVLFIVLNRHAVKVNFVVTSTRLSVIWVILLSLVAGLVLGAYGARLRRRRRGR